MKPSRLGTLVAVLSLFLPALSSFAAVSPTPPTIPGGTNIFVITNPRFGAVSGQTNTTAIQAAITAAATSPAKGGTVEIPAGTFISGPLNLASGINLHLDAGAVLQMIPLSAYTSPGTGWLTASSLHDVEISGPGTIDGQGPAWWADFATNSALNRPDMVFFNGCNRVLITNVTLQNPPAQHLVFKSTTGNVDIENLTVNTSGSSPNTDGIDIVGTNNLIRNCNISDGDDNIAFGSSGAVSANILVTNCTFGTGHGVSVGSHTSSGVSNITVINCSFTGTVNGIRLKSDDSEGGTCQNMNYFNITMTNVNFPIQIYSYYQEVGTPSSITPQTAAGEPIAALNETPLWRNITISNLTATANNGFPVGILWARTELPMTNITLANLNITGHKTFDIYNARGVQFINPQFNLPAGVKTFTLYNADVTVTNTGAGSNAVTFDGLASTNSISLYNVSAATSDSTALGANPITVGAGTLTVANSLTLSNSSALNFLVGSNTSSVTATGDLALAGTLNITNGGGFGAGTFTLFTSGGTVSGNAGLGSTPAGFTCSLVTNEANQVKLIAQSPTPPQPTLSGAVIAAQNLGFVLSGAGGPLNGTYIVLTSTNLALPLDQWTPLATNLFDGTGRFSFSAGRSLNPSAYYTIEWHY